MSNQINTMAKHFFSVFIIGLLVTGFSFAEEKDKNRYEDQDIIMRLVIRSPEQLTAFYQGREFPKKAIDEILSTCFITPLVKNKKLDALWLELDEWQFFDNQGKPINRIKRDYWKQNWQNINLKQAYQSTFGWTLMPEVRDLRLDEGVGGSIVLPWQDKPFTLLAKFKTGENKQGPQKTVTFKGVECKSDIAQE